MVDKKAAYNEVDVQEVPEVNDHKRKRSHRFRKAILVLGVSFLLMWTLHLRCRGTSLHEGTEDADLRKRRIEIGSQALHGNFDLLDLLSIQSTSGSINIGVHPQPADAENPIPAELVINSHSGQVSIDFLAFNAPERDYRVSIDSRHGSVDGHLLHGRMTSIVSNSASIKAQILPFAANNYASTLRTASQSGSQEIAVLALSNDPGVPINRMSSTHSTNSGSLVLRYPKEWQGTIEGHTRAGSLRLHGGDLDIIRRSSSSNVGHYVLARKGSGNSTLNFLTGSGSVNIYFD